MKRITVTAWVLLAAVLFMLPLAADVSKGMLRAVVVGCDYKESSSLAKLSFARTDAKAFADALSRHSPYDNQNIILLSDTVAADNTLSAGWSNIMQRLELQLEAAGPDDQFVFFFSGHGVMGNDIRTGEKTLLMLGQDYKELKYRAYLALSEIRDLASHSRAGSVVFVIDACRKGMLKDKGASLEDTVDTDTIQAEKKIAVFFSTGTGQNSYEDISNGMGLFSRFVVEGLVGKTAQSGNSITLADLSLYVSQGVKEYAIGVLGTQQSPYIVIPDAGVGMTPIAVKTEQRASLAGNLPVEIITGGTTQVATRDAAREKVRFESLGTGLFIRLGSGVSIPIGTFSTVLTMGFVPSVSFGMQFIAGPGSFIVGLDVGSDMSSALPDQPAAYRMFTQPIGITLGYALAVGSIFHFGFELNGGMSINIVTFASGSPVPFAKPFTGARADFGLSILERLRIEIGLDYCILFFDTGARMALVPGLRSTWRF